jgi:hypothetical protein
MSQLLSQHKKNDNNDNNIAIIVIIISYSLFTGFSWYFSSWTSGEPHHSGFKFLIVVLSL